MMTSKSLMPGILLGTRYDRGNEYYQVESPTGKVYTAVPSNVYGWHEGRAILKQRRAEQLSAEGYKVEVRADGSYRVFCPRKHGADGGYIVRVNGDGDGLCDCPSVAKDGECKHTLGLSGLLISCASVAAHLGDEALASSFVDLAADPGVVAREIEAAAVATPEPTPVAHALPAGYEVPRFSCRLVLSCTSAWIATQAIQCPRDLAELFAGLLEGLDREALYVALLDSKNRIIGVNLVSLGILDSSLVHPREVFKPAILLGAASIVLAHNHPSGDPTPSPEDRRVTQRIDEAGKLLGIDVMDHVIVGDKGHFTSFKERGIL
jgi:DNA repair protein RadC